MQIRNIAIIAHVDHGKTTLVDGMLKQTHTFRDNQAEMTQTTILDSNDLERERGITILSKNTVVFYNDYKINIIDTPGHADFSGEVERVISMADGALLIVDAAEGPLPQTRFVLEQALKQAMPIIVVVNKIDRKDAEPERVLQEVEDLFLQVAEDASHLDFPVIYAIGREGKAWNHLPADWNEDATLEPVFQQIIETVPAPKGDPSKPFKMQISNLDFDSYKGIFAVGKISQGTVKPGQRISLVLENTVQGTGTVQEVLTSKGLSRVNTPEAFAGDIVALTGLTDIAIGLTVTDPSDPTGYPAIFITEPTLSIQINTNTSPFSGREGEFVTIRQIGDRLQREQKTNIGLRVTENQRGSGFIVAGRGELHLAILIETMRREGYEFEVSKPEVIIKEINGVKSEPREELTVEISQDYTGVIMEELSKRRAELKDSRTDDKGVVRMIFELSSKNLLGFRSEIVSKTRGNGLFASRFLGFFPVSADIIGVLRNGAIIASDTGTATAYALESIQQRGSTFVAPGVNVYEGQVIGLHKRQEDLEMNAAKGKKLTNMRAASADQMIQLAPPVDLSLEQCIDFIQDDELLEVTPLSLRVRKKHLNKNERNKARK